MWGWVKKAASAVRKVAVGAAHAVRGVASLAVQLGKAGFHRFIGIPEFVGTLFGWMPEKQISIEPLILMKDGTALASLADVQAAMDLAAGTFHEQVNVRVVNRQGGRPLILAEEVPPDNLSPSCAHVKPIVSTFSDVGAWFRDHQVNTVGGAILGFGQPVTVFVVENVEEAAGCCPGFLSDYAVIDPGALSDPESMRLTLAHEVGHACGLTHPFLRPGNLMKHRHVERGRRLSRFQRAVFRSSGHVTSIHEGTIVE